jgi:hypothetical protein
MDEITRKKVIEIIKNSIDEVVYDKIKQLPEKQKVRQDELNRTKAQRSQDVHNALFGSEDEQMVYKIKLHESNEKPKVTTVELDSFKQEMKGHLDGIDLIFYNGINGQIVDFPVKNRETDATCYGKITVNKNSLLFSMSLLNGLKIKSVVENGNIKEFEISKSTKVIFDKMLNLYEEVFKEKFSEIINPTDESEMPVLGQTETPYGQSAMPQTTPLP